MGLSMLDETNSEQFQWDESQSSDRHLRVRETTGICKTDCLILEMDHDIFDILIKQKMRRDKEKVVNHIIKSLPGIMKFYSQFRISE